MKSSFLLTVILGALISSTVFGQNTTTASKTTIVEKDSFQRFYDRLKISYFAAYQGSSLGQWDREALDEHGGKYDDYAHNFFNQISFNYNFGAKMNFIVNPRWTLNTGGTSSHSRETNGVLVVEDTLVGFSGVVHSSADKKFNLFLRPALRLPTSRTSRKNDVTIQPELFAIPTYDFNTKWQIGSYIQARQWVYDQRYTAYRYRVFVGPYVQYTVNDKTKISAYYENYSENRRNLESQNGKKPNFQEYWQNAMVAVSYDVTPKFNVMPFLGYMLNTTYAADRPLDPAWVGAWISYQIK